MFAFIGGVVCGVAISNPTKVKEYTVAFYNWVLSLKK